MCVYIYTFFLYDIKDQDILRNRLIARHMHTGLTEEEAIVKVDTCDLNNAAQIRATKKKATRHIWND